MLSRYGTRYIDTRVILDARAFHVYSLKSQIAELHVERELLGARPEFGAQAGEVPKVTTSNVGAVIGALFVEIEKLFDNPHKAADALKLLTDLAKVT